MPSNLHWKNVLLTLYIMQNTVTVDTITRYEMESGFNNNYYSWRALQKEISQWNEHLLEVCNIASFNKNTRS